MKIGILTYHRSHNFGALFQAIATRNVLLQMGHQVSYIDYWPDYHKAMYALFSWGSFRRKNRYDKFLYVKDCIFSFRGKKVLKDKFEKFINSYIIPFCEPMGTSYDLIIYGSDQIWRKQPWLDTYNPVYFGLHKSFSKLHATYAASMGIISNETSDHEKLKSLIGNMNYISVREESLLDFVHELGYKNAILSIDPVLLLTANQWKKIIQPNSCFLPPHHKYVLYINYIPFSFNESAIRLFAKEHDCDFVKINGAVIGKDTPDARIDTGPLEFLLYITKADYIFTSSFHALAFSILFQKEFYAAFSNNAGRASSLLAKLNLDNRLKNNEDETFVEDVINYNAVNSILDSLRDDSINYIKTITKE